MINSSNAGKLHNSEIKFVNDKFLSFLIVDKILEVNPFALPKPDKESLKDIIEYQQMYDLMIEVLVAKHATDLIKQAADYTSQVLNLNKEIQYNDDIIWPKPLQEVITRVRQSMGNKTKEQWVIYEEAIEKILVLSAKENRKIKIKSRPGRPRKFHTSIHTVEDAKSSLFMEAFLSSNTLNECEDMDVD